MMKAKRLEMSKLDISLAIKEALKSLEGGNESNIGNLFSDDDEHETISAKKTVTDGNYHSSPEVENHATPRNSGCSDGVDKFKNTCCQCHRMIGKHRRL